MICLSQLFTFISTYRLGIAKLLGAGRGNSELGMGIGAESKNRFTIDLESLQQSENTTQLYQHRSGFLQQCVDYRVTNRYWEVMLLFFIFVEA